MDKLCLWLGKGRAIRHLQRSVSSPLMWHQCQPGPHSWTPSRVLRWWWGLDGCGAERPSGGPRGWPAQQRDSPGSPVHLPAPSPGPHHCVLWSQRNTTVLTTVKVQTGNATVEYSKSWQLNSNTYTAVKFLLLLSLLQEIHSIFPQLLVRHPRLIKTSF